MQGERTGSGVHQEGGEADGGTETVKESQGGRERTVNGAAKLLGQLGQVVIPAESRADVSAHGFWKRVTTAMFRKIIVNLNTGSYLCMMPESLLQRQRRKIRTCTFRLACSVEVLLLLWFTLRTEHPEQRP